MKQSDVEETLNRLKTHKSVVGIIICNADGSTIRSTLDSKTTALYAPLLSRLTAQAKSVVTDIDAQDGLTFLRVRTRKHEILLAPEKDYILVVVQDPDVERSSGGGTAPLFTPQPPGVSASSIPSNASKPPTSPSARSPTVGGTANAAGGSSTSVVG